MGQEHELAAAEAALFAAEAYSFRYRQGAKTFRLGPLQVLHYERPLFWETDNFRAVGIPAYEVVDLVHKYSPGPHLISVATTDPTKTAAEYSPLGYTTSRGEPVETIMVRPTAAAAIERHVYTVERASDDRGRRLYNSTVDADDGHGRMTEPELADPFIGYYFVEEVGICVCSARALHLPGDSVAVEPLLTHPNHRRRGLATSVMEAIASESLRHGASTLVVDASQGGIPLYLALGFKVVGYIQKLVPSGSKNQNLSAPAST